MNIGAHDITFWLTTEAHKYSRHNLDSILLKSDIISIEMDYHCNIIQCITLDHLNSINHTKFSWLLV